MSEKFNLQWNDFQSTVLQSFKSIRADKDFLNVTLVTDDEVHIEAHKVILAASSPFLGNILKKSPHKHPLIYLSGISSINLNLILDYVYFGEVQLLQEQLDDFLLASSKLKISGLTGNEKEEEYDNTEGVLTDTFRETQEKEFHVQKQSMQPKRERPQKPHIVSRSLSSEGDTSAEELNTLLSEQMEKIDSVYICKVCQKTSKDKAYLGKHIEVHLEGLCFTCPECKQQFSSRESRRMHQKRTHTSF